MKFRISVSKEKYDQIKDYLTKMGIETGDDPVGTDPDHLEFMKYSLFIYSPSGELLFKNR